MGQDALGGSDEVTSAYLRRQGSRSSRAVEFLWNVDMPSSPQQIGIAVVPLSKLLDDRNAVPFGGQPMYAKATLCGSDCIQGL